MAALAGTQSVSSLAVAGCAIAAIQLLIILYLSFKMNSFAWLCEGLKKTACSLSILRR